MSERRRIMCVGFACIDIVSVVSSYPEEDTDQRCLDYYWQRGGNASNSSTVISVLGLPVEYMGVLADDMEASWLRKDFEKRSVKLDHCVTSRTGSCPVTSTISSQETGTRTIVYSERGLPELRFEDFDKVDLKSNNYKWIHFEGRPTWEELDKMLTKIDNHNMNADPKHRITTSMEIEKVIFEGLESLVCRPDYVFFSKEWSRSKGLNSMEESVEHYSQKVKSGGTVICAWGELGAAAKQSGGDIISIPAFPPPRVIDTLGCGDTFVGSVIAALSSEKCLKDSIEFGCRVAGAKCGMKGLADLHQFQTFL